MVVGVPMLFHFILPKSFCIQYKRDIDTKGVALFGIGVACARNFKRVNAEIGECFSINSRLPSNKSPE